MIQNLLNNIKSFNLTLITAKIAKYLDIFKIYILSFLAFSMFSWYIWLRFIRVRLPKNIPIDLSELGLYIIIYICCIYYYIVLRLIIPKNTNIILSKFIDLIYKPLITLDIKIKTRLKTKHEKLIYKIIPILYNLTGKQMRFLYYFMYIIPRFVLVFTLSLDVFYF